MCCLCSFIQLDVDYHEGLMTNCIAEQLIAAAASSAKHCPWLVLICFELFRSLCQVVSEVGIITNGAGVIIIRCHLSTFGIRILFHQRQFIEIAEMFGDVWSRTRSMSIHESSWSLHILALKTAYFLDLSPLQAARWMQLETWTFSLYRRSKWVLKFSRNLPKGQWYQKKRSNFFAA